MYFQVCKSRGMTLNSRNAAVLNFESMKDALLNNLDLQLTLQDPYKIIRKEDGLFTEEQTKTWRIVYDKRQLLPDLKTLPFGWKE